MLPADDQRERQGRQAALRLFTRPSDPGAGQQWGDPFLDVLSMSMVRDVPKLKTLAIERGLTVQHF
ncbi:hypothetical protein [Frankia sp. Cas4]|uniref:hypothetical protein n=1 Tax=Frankia sp. Cas4 TaxID=3073927 RepID=UPI002AD543D0|nr:hypothetical protein [Frankia sp. Cas4]